MAAMEEDMEVEVFEVVEVDLDYEYEAPRFFDFTREETQAETREAELWFESAKSYPPSPFVAKLFSMDNGFLGNIHVSPKSKCVQEQYEMHKGIEGTSQLILKTLQSCNMLYQQRAAQTLNAGSVKGSEYNDHISKDVKKTKASLPRRSTLMKPTASQLAKQNQRSRIAVSRFEKPHTAPNTPCPTEVQASKRRKLEGGQLRKVGDMAQSSNLVHKAPKKDIATPGTHHGRLRITIPVEPDLVTARRAQRSRDMAAKEADDMVEGTSRCGARPMLGRRVRHLKRVDVATQHTSAVVSGQPEKGMETCGLTQDKQNIAGTRSNAVDNQSDNVDRMGHTFKARPLDKKIFRKGDNGISRNTKRAVTVTKEFEFQTTKRATQKPLTELLSKLSLAPELQSKCSVSSKLPQPTLITSFKGSKENVAGGCVVGDPNIKHLHNEMKSRIL